MKSLSRITAALLTLPAGLACLLAAETAAAQSQRALDVRAARAIQHWTPERRAAAIPRDLVIDERGLGYIRASDGRLLPHGHDIAPLAKPGGGGDTAGPVVSGMDPGDGEVIGASASFSATVTDPSGVKSVSFKLQSAGGGRTYSFAASHGAGDTWSVSLSGFSDGAWIWYVVAKDNAKPSNTTTSAVVSFTVDTSGGGGGGPGSVPNEEWTGGGVVQQAAGRIYFEMPSNKRRTNWAGYVCSGTVANDATTGRSIIITAAHCVYDDANKAYARNVLFIPNQAETSGTGTDLNCANDPIGCWAPELGVVDVNWTNRTFPDNVAWDYAYYVVSDTGAHAGAGAASDTLDAAVVPMSVSFAPPAVDDLTHALGYSYDVDPQFMYCADPMESLDAANWWLPSCGLSGGSSGGPWVQPFDVNAGDGPIVSVNSWGYTNSPGMAGPKLAGTSASCVFDAAKSATLGLDPADGDAGLTVTSCP